MYGKIDLPFNEQLQITLNPKKSILQIKSLHIRAYKKNINKKGNHWEKVNIWSFPIFKQTEKKSLDYKFDILVKSSEIKKFYEKEKIIVEEFKRNRVVY